jgi:hypothetical protein
MPQPAGQHALGGRLLLACWPVLLLCLKHTHRQSDRCLHVSNGSSPPLQGHIPRTLSKSPVLLALTVHVQQVSSAAPNTTASNQQRI